MKLGNEIIKNKFDDIDIKVDFSDRALPDAAG